MIRTTALLAALLAAPLALAQPAANANPNAFKNANNKLSAECQKMHDEYLRQRDAQRTARVESSSDDARMTGANPELKDARKAFEAKCGALPADMTPKPGDEDGDDKGGRKDQMRERISGDGKSGDGKSGDGKGSREDQMRDRLQGDRGGKDDATPTTRKEIEKQTGVDLPKKAGPATGTGSDTARCAQLHKGMVDALAKESSCGKDKECRKVAKAGYERARNAYESGCGEVPADAKPKKR